MPVSLTRKDVDHSTARQGMGEIVNDIGRERLLDRPGATWPRNTPPLRNFRRPISLTVILSASGDTGSSCPVSPA